MNLEKAFYLSNKELRGLTECKEAKKDWSLTDCISFVVMRDEGLSDALTGDHYFHQAGSTALLK